MNWTLFFATLGAISFAMQVTRILIWVDEPKRHR